MDRVPADKARNLIVPAYESLSRAAGYPSIENIDYVERFQFYEDAKKCFAIIQTDDCTLYANAIIAKGVI